ncbi:MAG: NYN domain-containing protein [Sedimentisphaerales bacterium]|jgi:predicted RNA-binding protein with PIN domain
MPVIIDGHNLLWAIRGAEDDASKTDAALCRILDGYFGLVGERGEIIFDGIGPPNKTEFNNIRNLEVTFSGRSNDCDSVIEQRILASTAPKQLTVVSSDRRLRKAAAARKATAVKSEDFWKDVEKQLSRQRKSKEPTGKRRGLTESETELWLKAFGLEQ